jgi:hypothetical protein
MWHVWRRDAYRVLVGKPEGKRPLVRRRSTWEDNIKQIFKEYDVRSTCEIQSWIVMAKAAFNKKRALFTSKMDVELRKKLVKCYIRIIVLYGAETWTFWATDHEHLESCEMWCWSWTDHVRNEEVLLRVKSRGISYMK